MNSGDKSYTFRTSSRTSMSRRTKLESCEGIKGTSTVQQSYKPNLQSTGSSHHEDQRNTLWRRSARLNPGSWMSTLSWLNER
ncbi:hypothetical protein BRADI_1g03953v3 [Brachypodium distachyon]|uniref:Uncharacterized protein n=1 Tax=Brachypodium distachyon TaxID=15368 RepID=A0A0Q3J3D2_BRADI|nr:hypothetical protein BRADI_1g03953v3 [Brachypodium distachyon]